MADESTDISSKKSHQCVHIGCKSEQHFVCIVQAKETTAEALTGYLCVFLESKYIDINKMHGFGFEHSVRPKEWCSDNQWRIQDLRVEGAKIV